jgi:hypothetical protein
MEKALVVPDESVAVAVRWGPVRVEPLAKENAPVVEAVA